MPLTSTHYDYYPNMTSTIMQFFFCAKHLYKVWWENKAKKLTVEFNYVSKGRGEGFGVENSIVVPSTKDITKSTFENRVMCYYCL